MTIVLFKRLNRIQQGLKVLRKYGSNAHLYLPGIGTINGITAGNYLDSAGTTLATVDNPVGLVKDAILSGAINASQATPANKPTLRRGVTNLLTYSGDLTNAAWAQQNGGSATANTVTFAAGSGSQRVQSFSTASVPVTVAAKVSVASGTKTFRFKIWNGTVDQYSSDFTATTTPQVFTFTATGGSTSAPNISICNSTIGDVGTVIVDGVGLFPGTLTASQILACGGIPLTTSAAASSSGGNWGWQFTAANSQYLGLSSVPFTSTEDHTMVAGALNQDVSATAKAVFSVGGAGAGFITLDFAGSTSYPRAIWRDDASTQVTLSGSVGYVGSPIVVSARKLGSQKVLRVNGAVAATQPSDTLGTLAATNAVFGARYVTGGVGSFNSGVVFPPVLIKGAVSDADLLAIERMVGALTGPTGVTF